jgi:hypothetical protein
MPLSSYDPYSLEQPHIYVYNFLNYNFERNRLAKDGF